MTADEMNGLTHSDMGVLRRGHRWIALLIIIALSGAVAFAIPKLAPLRTTAGPAGWRIFHEPKNDWSVQFPASWHAQRIKEVHRSFPYTAEAHGIFISNIQGRFEHPRLPKGQWSFAFDLSDVPDDFAAVQVMWRYTGGFVIRCTTWGGPFPLSLKHSVRATPTLRKDRLDEVNLTFAARHEPLYSIQAWTGPAASDADRAKLERIVTTIKFDDAKEFGRGYDRKCFG